MVIQKCCHGNKINNWLDSLLQEVPIMFIKEYLAMVLSIFCAFSNLDAAVNELSPGDAKFLKSCLGAVQASVSPSRYTSSIGVAARSNFIRLSPAQIEDVLEDVDLDLLFKTPYGFSLIHGWMLNQFTERAIPFYISQHFSFDKYFKSMIAMMPVPVQALLVGKWAINAAGSGARNSIEADRWSYFTMMQYIPSAIAQAGVPAGVIPNMPEIIKNSYVLTLSVADFNAHVDSIKAGGALTVSPERIREEQVRKESIMLWLLNSYDINTLLPDDRELDQTKYQEFLAYIEDESQRAGVSADAFQIVNGIEPACFESLIELIRQQHALPRAPLAPPLIVTPNATMLTYSKITLILEGVPHLV